MKSLNPIKKILQFSLVFLFLLGNSSFTRADVVTWIGGNNNWNIASNWDKGLVPESDDEVFINDGTVHIYTTTAEAEHVFIGTNASLRVETNGKIVVEDSWNVPGIHNTGELRIYGDVVISDVGPGLFWLPTSMGIVNDATMRIEYSGKIEISSTEHFGIFNRPGATCRNYGEIVIWDVKITGIQNVGNFRNYGRIDCEIPMVFSFNPTYGIYNHGTFWNYAQADINLHDCGHGLLNYNYGRFYNYGNIELEDNSLMGFENNNNIYNYATGQIYIIGSPTGSINYDYFKNYGELIVKNASIQGIVSQGVFVNLGYVEVAGPASNSVDFSGGQFTNTKEAKFITNRRIEFSNGASWGNAGFLVSHIGYGNGVQSTGSVTGNNKGVVNCPTSSINIGNNDQLFLTRMTGTIQNGVPFYNAIDLNGHANLKFHGIYIDAALSEKAGSYDSASNVFVPNKHAIGLKTLYFDLEIVGAGNFMVCPVTITNPVLPMVSLSDDAIAQEDLDRNNARHDLQAYPNPTTREITLSSDLFDQQDTEVTIYNSLGQLVFKQNFARFDRPMLEMPEALASGIYFLQCLQNRKLMASEYIQLSRS